jgi:hypothetical protein
MLDSNNKNQTKERMLFWPHEWPGASGHSNTEQTLWFLCLPTPKVKGGEDRELFKTSSLKFQVLRLQVLKLQVLRLQVLRLQVLRLQVLKILSRSPDGFWADTLAEPTPLATTPSTWRTTLPWPSSISMMIFARLKLRDFHITVPGGSVLPQSTMTILAVERNVPKVSHTPTLFYLPMTDTVVSLVWMNFDFSLKTSARSLVVATRRTGLSVVPTAISTSIHRWLHSGFGCW